MMLLEQNADVLQARGLVEAVSTLQLFVMPLKNLVVLVNYQNLLLALTRLQEWNKPWQKKVPIIPVHQLNARRCEILQKECSDKILSTFDPHQPEDRRLCEGAIEKLRCDLLQLNQHCAFLDVLIPSVDKIAHDHTYALPPVEDRSSDVYDRAMPEDQSNSDEHDNFGGTLNDDNEELNDDDLVTLGLKVTDMERFDIERETRSLRYGMKYAINE